LKKTALNLAEHCLFNKTQFTQTHPIAFFKTTMLNMVGHCLLKLPHFTPTHLIANSHKIEQILLVVVQCI
jgi:hypothetical protein